MVINGVIWDIMGMNGINLQIVFTKKLWYAGLPWGKHTRRGAKPIVCPIG